MSRSTLQLLSTLLLALTAVLAAPAGAREPERLQVPFSDPSRPGTIKVSLVNGGVTVEAHQGKEVVVEAVTDEDDDDVPDKARGMHRIPNTSLGLTVEEEGNLMRIEVDSWNQSTNLKLKVPVSTALNLTCVNDGDIEVSGVRGEMELANTNGNIRVKGAAAAVVAHTVNGDITVTFAGVDPAKSMSFSTLNGDVDLTLPVGTKVDVRMQSGNGEIYSAFDVAISPQGASRVEERKGSRYRVRLEKEMRGSINGGGPELHLKSFNGDIYIRRGG